MWLAYDTTGHKSCAGISMALMSDRASGSLVGEHAVWTLRGCAQHGVPEIWDFVKRCGVAWSDLQGVIVCVGPGSFTGIRIGLAALQGWHMVYPQPITWGMTSCHSLAACAEVPPTYSAIGTIIHSNNGVWVHVIDRHTWTSDVHVQDNEIRHISSDDLCVMQASSTHIWWVAWEDDTRFRVDHVVDRQQRAVGLLRASVLFPLRWPLMPLYAKPSYVD